MENKNRFWKHFELRKWIVNSIFVTLWLYISQLIAIFIFKEPSNEIGTFGNFLASVITAILASPVMTLLGIRFEFRKRNKESH